MEAPSTFETRTTVDGSKRPAKRTYRRRTVPSSKASTIKRRHANGSSDTHQEVVIDLPIKSTVPLRWILSSATQLLVEHLLFSRGLIPLSAAQLRDIKHEEVLKSQSQRRKVAQCRNRLESWHKEWAQIDRCAAQLRDIKHEEVLKSQSQRRKVAQCRNRLESWHKEWAQIDRCILEKCSCISISLGTSIQRSKEFYVLNVAEERNSSEHPISKLPPIHALARRLLPRFVECDTELPNRSAPSYQLWVSLLVQAEALQEIFNDASNALANLTIRRPAYKLPKKGTMKPDQRVVEIRILNGENNVKPSVEKKTDRAHWISVRTSIKGFRLS